MEKDRGEESWDRGVSIQRGEGRREKGVRTDEYWGKECEDGGVGEGEVPQGKVDAEESSETYDSSSTEQPPNAWRTEEWVFDLRPSHP